MIAIDVDNPLAEKLNDVDDVEKEMPGYLHETYVWFRDYKGTNCNKFAFEGKPKSRVQPQRCQPLNASLTTGGLGGGVHTTGLRPADH